MQASALRHLYQDVRVYTPLKFLKYRDSFSKKCVPQIIFTRFCFVNVSYSLSLLDNLRQFDWECQIVHPEWKILGHPFVINSTKSEEQQQSSNITAFCCVGEGFRQFNTHNIIIQLRCFVWWRYDVFWKYMLICYMQ